MTIEQLIKHRKKLGLTVKTMAKLTGYSAVWLYKIERKENKHSERVLKEYESALARFASIVNK